MIFSTNDVKRRLTPLSFIIRQKARKCKGYGRISAQNLPRRQLRRCAQKEAAGLVKNGVENTIDVVGRLARFGMKETDEEIIRLMLED